MRVARPRIYSETQGPYASSLLALKGLSPPLVLKVTLPLLHSHLILMLLSLHIQKNYSQIFHEINHDYARICWFVANCASVTSLNKVKLTITILS